MSTIVLDLGGTRIKIGIVRNGELLDSRILESFSDNGLVPRIPLIEDTVEAMMQKVNIKPGSITGVGISIPGIVDSKEMKVLSINKKFYDATEFDFKKWVLKKWNVPIYTENDARAALVGEWQFGAGKECNNLVMVTLGTGVGGAAIIEGTLLRGNHFLAGCLAGHFTINYNGSICNCGNIGCVESEASTWSIVAKAKENPLYINSELSKSGLFDYKNLFMLSAKNDPLAKELVELSLRAWSAGVINLIHAYDPEKVIIGGGIIKSASTIIPFIQEKVNQYAWTPWGKVEVFCAQNPDWAGILGIDYLLRKHYKIN